MNSLIFYKGGNKKEIEDGDENYMHAGIPLTLHQDSNYKIGGGGKYDSYVVPVGLYSEHKPNTRRADPSDDSEPDVPVVNPVFFDKLFGKVGHEIRENGNSKTRKLHH
jgi:hypothetical protein